MKRSNNIHRGRLLALFIVLSTIGMTLVTALSCDSYDCTLNNIVECKIGFYNTRGDSAYTIGDTVTVLDASTDSILLNKVTAVQLISIPLSYYKDKDTVAVMITNGTYEHTDWLIISKTNTEHFESLDCPVKMFHNITDVTSPKVDFIDSVAITSPIVEYNNGENIKICMHITE